MLKMIIADDEYMVREGLRDILCWEEFGIEIIGEASDGQEAIELSLELSPDILFTDIRMPFFDGIEVASLLAKSGKETKVIIFSGIQDFGYVKSALNINAEGYILKPLDRGELIEVVQKVVRKITTERNITEKINQLKQQLNENFGAARETFIRNLLLGINRKEEEMQEKMVYFKNPISTEEPLSVAVLEIDEYTKIIEGCSEEEKHLLGFSVATVVEEQINNYSKGICIHLNDNEYAMIFNIGKDVPSVTDSEIYLEILKSLGTYLNISASIGVGRIVNKLTAINSAFKDAVNALHFKFYTGKGSIINFSDIGYNPERQDYPNLVEEQNQLLGYIRSGNIVETEKTIQILFENLSKDKKFSIEYIRRISTEFVYSISRVLYEIGEDIGEVAGKCPELLDNLYKTESIFELKEELESFLLNIARHFSKKYTQKNKKVIHDIKMIIETRYMEDISVNKIAESIYLSPNYMSIVFKRETGETITDFLNKKRMEVAKDLLQKTDHKILDVANMVGFQDASYFSKVFKKNTGIYPQKFRTLGTFI